MKNEKNQLNKSCGCSDQITGSKVSLSSSENDFAYTSFGNYESLCGPESNTINSRHTRSASVADVNTKLSGPDVLVPQYKNGEYSVLPIDFKDWPTVENGILTFRDEEHFDTYYDYVETMFNHHSRNRTSESQQDFLEEIENKVNHISLRKILIDKFDSDNQKDQKEFTPISQMHFIPDSLLRSMLNIDSEVKIGDYITKYINSSLALSIKANNLHLLSEIRDMSSNVSKESINAFINNYPNDLIDNNWSVNSNRNTYFNIITHSENKIYNNVLENTFNSNDYIRDIENKYQKRTTSTDYVINITQAMITDNCDPLNVSLGVSYLYEYRKSVTLVIKGQGDWYEVNSHIVIDWGDGSPRTGPFPATVPSYSGYVAGGGVGRSHRYENPGKYRITVFAYKSANYYPTIPVAIGDPVALNGVWVVVGCVSGESRTSTKEKIRGDTYRKIIGTHYVQQWKTGIGKTAKSRTGAISEAYHWEKNFWGKWGYRRYGASDIFVGYKITKYDSKNCTLLENFKAESTKPKQWNVELQHSQNGHFAWNNICSQHELYSIPVNVIIAYDEFCTKRC